MADVDNVQSFPHFPQLPRELRLMIWEMACLHPRIVNIEMRLMYPKREKEVSNKTAENTRDIRHTGIKSNTPPPPILFACRESFAAATKFYERVFSTHHSFPETYFNFYQDTLYIRYDTFSWYSDRAESIIPSLICTSTQSQKELSRVKRLAVLLEPLTVSVEEWLVDLLWFFRGIERLSLVFHHYEENDIASPLHLIEAIDVYQACIDHRIYLMDPYGLGELPEILYNDNIGFVNVDLEVLRVAIEEKRGQDYILPEIDCGVIITQDLKEELDSLLEMLGDSG